MTLVNDIHNYEEDFVDKFVEQAMPIYDLWEIRPLSNDQKSLIKGSIKEKEIFRDFLTQHVEQNYPFAIKIILGNKVNGTENEMSKTRRQVYKLKFDEYKSIEPDEFLPILNGGSAMYHNQQFSMNPFGNVSPIITEMQETIKQLKEEILRRDTEYRNELHQARQEFEEYKFNVRESQLKEREERFYEMIEAQQNQFQQYMEESMMQLNGQRQAFQEEKSKGIYNFQEIAKSIGIGLAGILGKSFLGIDDLGFSSDNSKNHTTNNKTTDQDNKSEFTGTEGVGRNETIFEEKIENTEFTEENELEKVMEIFLKQDLHTKGVLLQSLYENFKDQTEEYKSNQMNGEQENNYEEKQDDDLNNESNAENENLSTDETSVVYIDNE